MEIIDSLWLAVGLCSFLFFTEQRENKSLRGALESAIEKMVVSEVVIAALIEELSKDDAEM